MSFTEDCPKGGCGGAMAINKKGTYVCPDCGNTATYYELHPDEDKVTVSDKMEVADFVDMRKQKDRVLSILRDTESILFQPIIQKAPHFLVKGMEHRDKPTVFLGKEAMQNIKLLQAAAKKRPAL